MTAPQAGNATLALLREQVRIARAHFDDLDAQYHAAQEQFEREHETLLTMRETAGREAEEAEAALRAAAEDHYRATGEKKPVAGVSIQERVVVKYNDADALAWAKASMPQLVRETVDARAFEKVAKAAPAAVPFVRVETVGKAAIATTLDAEVSV
jgi:hypothetical protein